jgi:Transposase IS66 family
MAEAIGYSLKHWAGLTAFLEDGRIEIDSNTVERTMRPIGLGRRNSLFAGSCGGAESWAMRRCCRRPGSMVWIPTPGCTMCWSGWSRAR